ncbi:hypothetical protein DUI87_35002 [Hirundo rustica rustica]|uniref:Uncharacterized protein n=1 Tax=Hirundo rustica rustica TaxID=333673 RepID=A0A3M0IIM0_HIRRU|nr:hypothetical protein DUI87_35002 [Hirundo rustica rustica]
MNLLLVGQSREEQGQWWLGETLGEDNVLTLLGGKVKLHLLHHGPFGFPAPLGDPGGTVGHCKAPGSQLEGDEIPPIRAVPVGSMDSALDGSQLETTCTLWKPGNEEGMDPWSRVPSLLETREKSPRTPCTQA